MKKVKHVRLVTESKSGRLGYLPYLSVSPFLLLIGVVIIIVLVIVIFIIVDIFVIIIMIIIVIIIVVILLLLAILITMMMMIIIIWAVGLSAISEDLHLPLKPLMSKLK